LQTEVPEVDNLGRATLRRVGFDNDLQTRTFGPSNGVRPRPTWTSPGRTPAAALLAHGDDVERLVSVAVDDRNEALRTLQAHLDRPFDAVVVETAPHELAFSCRARRHRRDASEVRGTEVTRRRRTGLPAERAQRVAPVAHRYAADRNRAAVVQRPRAAEAVRHAACRRAAGKQERHRHEQGRASTHGRIRTGVPSGSTCSSLRITAFETRTQPWLALRPSNQGSFVPWIATWPSPPANVFRTVECADRSYE